MYIPKVAVLFGFGINCDHETAAVFEMVGGKSTRVHLNSFITGLDDLSNYDICLLYTSPSPRDKRQSRMPSSA